jgi:beta-glucanase (GH16 family)
MKQLLLFLFTLSTSLSFGQVGNLIWEDNFNGNSLDTTKWSYETGTGVNGDWGTGQLDRATARPENVSFQDSVLDADGGCLVITTRKEWHIDRNYTSGRIRTADKASWGPGHRIVARVYPRDVKQQGQGFAFWMMPDEIPNGYNYIMWPQGGEIDIMEYVGSIPFHNLGSVHYAWFWENNQWQSWNHGHQGIYYSYEKQEVPYPSEPGYGGFPPAVGDTNAGSAGFHTYGIDWYNDRIEFFVDGHVYHVHYLEDGGGYQRDGQDEKSIQTINGRRVGVSEYAHHFSEWRPYEHKLYAILSGGVGGAQHTYGGPITNQAQFPCSVFIDWVKVYELDQNTNVEDEISASMIKIYPNPSNDQLNLELPANQSFNIMINDSAGSNILRTSLNTAGSIDISELSPGGYMIIVTDGKTSFSKKIIKK